jgi:hypothetical protein
MSKLGILSEAAELNSSGCAQIINVKRSAFWQAVQVKAAWYFASSAGREILRSC